MTLPERVFPEDNLPATSTLFVGRAEECGQVLERPERSVIPLVSIVGPGGVGKTRLAVECACICATSSGWPLRRWAPR